MLKSCDLENIAQAVGQLTCDEQEMSQIAVICTLYNRHRDGFNHDGISATDFGGEMLGNNADISHKKLSQSDFWSVMANICKVWAGQIADPTNGATAYHLHDTMPGWAVDERPTALIGKRFFYRLPVNG